MNPVLPLAAGNRPTGNLAAVKRGKQNSFLRFPKENQEEPNENTVTNNTDEKKPDTKQKASEDSWTKPPTQALTLAQAQSRHTVKP